MRYKLKTLVKFLLFKRWLAQKVMHVILVMQGFLVVFLFITYDKLFSILLRVVLRDCLVVSFMIASWHAAAALAGNPRLAHAPRRCPVQRAWHGTRSCKHRQRSAAQWT